MTTTSATQSFDGYSLICVREIPAPQGVAFDAIVVKDGRKVLHVYQGGEGGSHTYYPVDRNPKAFAEALSAFEDFARHWNQDSPFAGQEDADALVWHLLEVATLNKKRSVVFTIDGEDYFETGVARRLGSAVTYEQALAYLRQAYPGRQASIWNKTRSEFVPVD